MPISSDQTPVVFYPYSYGFFRENLKKGGTVDMSLNKNRIKKNFNCAVEYGYIF